MIRVYSPEELAKARNESQEWAKRQRAGQIEGWVKRHHEQSFHCGRHGWSAVGVPCPKCRAGDAPDRCGRHGWMAYGVPCPDCVKGK